MEERRDRRGRGLAWLALLLAALALLGGVPAVAQGLGDDVNADWHTLRTPPLADGQGRTEKTREV